MGSVGGYKMNYQSDNLYRGLYRVLYNGFCRGLQNELSVRLSFIEGHGDEIQKRGYVVDYKVVHSGQAM